MAKSHKSSKANDSDLLGIDDALKLLGTSRPTFYRWVREGKVKGMKAGRRWRFYRSDLERFLKGHEPRIELTGNITPLLEGLAAKLTEVKATALPALDEPIAEACQRLLQLAVILRGDGLHIEPPGGMDRPARVRLRLDGVLHPLIDFDSRLLSPMIERLKSLASCDVREKKRPQDGRIMLKLPAGEVDLRMCFIPAVMGEAATARILRREGHSFALANLPYGPLDVEKIRKALALPWGVILVSGPTGTGKTTTLYSMLHELNHPHLKLVTVEDPVEYVLDGIVQVPVRNPETTFAAAIRALIRSDPDVLMVGEIRDIEVLGLIQQVALTGHLVLSTLHTDDAPKALERMRDMGLDPFLAADTTRLIISQRLIRKVCPKCSVETPLTAEQRDMATQMASARGLRVDDLPNRFRKAVGCSACASTGYKGRTLIAEVLEVTPALADGIRKRLAVDQLRALAVAGGMTTMTADGVRRAAEGQTTLDEVIRMAPRA